MFEFILVGLGCMVGGTGFLQIAETPVLGCSSLLLSGFIILAGVDRSGDLNDQ